MSQFFLYVFKVKVQLLDKDPTSISVEKQKQKEDLRVLYTVRNVINRIAHC